MINFSGRTVIVTGSNGQLGQFLIKYFQDNFPEIKVVGTIRHKSYDDQSVIYDKSKVIFELMDLSDAVSIENLILKYKPEYLINTGANAFVGESWSVPLQQMDLNCLGVLRQLEAIRKFSPHTRYFNMGTSEEFGNDIKDDKLQDESTLINPKSPYGCSKAAARYLVNTYRNSYNLYAIQGWTFNFESEARGVKYVTKKITQNVARIYHAIKNNQPFKALELGNLDSYRSWQFCGDVADGIWRQLNQEIYNDKLKSEFNPQNLFGAAFSQQQCIEWLSKNIKTYVLSASHCHTVREFAELAFKYAGIYGYWIGSGANEQFAIKENKADKPDRVLININPEFVRFHDVTYLNGDASLAKKELGWKSTLSFEQLVKRMVYFDIDNYKL